MKTSMQWVEHFRTNLTKERVDWNIAPAVSETEISIILRSLQAWQLGETSEGKHLTAAATKYAQEINDPDYVPAVALFIKEEQKHGNNLGKYLDAINRPRIKKDWGDSLFRKIRYFNTDMEIWTLAVIVVESVAQVYYQALKDATGCNLLKQICTDILIDEAYHIHFQLERLQIIHASKSRITRFLYFNFYSVFFYFTIRTVWFAHGKLFRAGGIPFNKYLDRMGFKYKKTLLRLKKTSPFSVQEYRMELPL